MQSAITTIDLFAGAGGLSAGLCKASERFTPVLAVESNLAAAATFKMNHPDTDVRCMPIQQVLRMGQIPSADLVVGGPPCQGFSPLGRRDDADSRNSLWEQYFALVALARPKYFVLENVPRFLESDQFKMLRGGIGCRGDGRLSDYELSVSGVLNAADFGCAQVRRRAVVIGRRQDQAPIGLPVGHLASSSRWRTVRDAWSMSPGLSAIPQETSGTLLPERWCTFEGRAIRGEFKTSELHVDREYSPMTAARIRYVPYGGSRTDIPLALLPDCWRYHTRGAADVMGRLVWERPAVTIRTAFVKPEKGRYLHPTENRAITLMEGARLQGFDDDYLWCGSKTDIARQIGNAVPVELACAIGRQLLAEI